MCVVAMKSLFVRHFGRFFTSKSWQPFMVGYFLSLTVVILWHFPLPLIGIPLSFLPATLAGGYYFRAMRIELESGEIQPFEVWPQFDLSAVKPLFSTGLMVCLVQLVYAAVIAGIGSSFFLLMRLGHVDFITASQITAVSCSAIAIWCLLVMCPIALVRLAATSSLPEALSFGTICKSSERGFFHSNQLKVAACIYFIAVAANLSLLFLSTSLCIVLEPFIEFVSMAIVLRLNARWHRHTYGSLKNSTAKFD